MIRNWRERYVANIAQLSLLKGVDIFRDQVVRAAALESSLVLDSVAAVRLLAVAVSSCAEDQLKDVADQMLSRLAVSLQVCMRVTGCCEYRRAWCEYSYG